MVTEKEKKRNMISSGSHSNGSLLVEMCEVWTGRSSRWERVDIHTMERGSWTVNLQLYFCMHRAMLVARLIYVRNIPPHVVFLLFAPCVRHSPNHWLILNISTLFIDSFAHQLYPYLLVSSLFFLRSQIDRIAIIHLHAISSPPQRQQDGMRAEFSVATQKPPEIENK